MWQILILVVIEDLRSIRYFGRRIFILVSYIRLIAGDTLRIGVTVLEESQREVLDFVRDCVRSSSAKRENFNRVIYLNTHFVVRST